jgi:hypothetical protein
MVLGRIIILPMDWVRVIIEPMALARTIIIPMVLGRTIIMLPATLDFPGIPTCSSSQMEQEVTLTIDMRCLFRSFHALEQHKNIENNNVRTIDKTDKNAPGDQRRRIGRVSD